MAGEQEGDRTRAGAKIVARGLKASKKRRRKQGVMQQVVKGWCLERGPLVGTVRARQMDRNKRE